MKDAVLGIHFQFNVLGSEATSLFDIGRWTFNVGRSFSHKFRCYPISNFEFPVFPRSHALRGNAYRKALPSIL